MSLQKLKFKDNLAEGLGAGSVKMVPSRYAAKLINDGKAELADEADELKVVPFEGEKVKSRVEIYGEKLAKKLAKKKADDDKEAKAERTAKQKEKDEARKKGAELRKERGVVIDKTFITEDEVESKDE